MAVRTELPANKRSGEIKRDKVREYLPLLGGGKWKEDGLIGKGGNGSVFRVYSGNGLRREEKAVKLISIDSHHVDLTSWKSMLQRGEITEETYQKNAWNAVNNKISEMYFMALLSSCPNILAYEDYLFFETDYDRKWNALVLMDILTPLNKHLTRSGAGKHDILYMWRDITRALQFCSERGILHLDIKDANILVTDDGTYKLIDWGQAHYERDIGILIEEKRSVHFGTESFMAPEVYQNNPPVIYDKRVDLYSLGLVVYYYYNNMRLPFADKPWGQLTEEERERVKRRRFKGNELLPRPAGIDDDVWRVLEKTCAYAPVDRYPDAQTQLRDIDALIQAREKKSGGGIKGWMIATAAAMTAVSIGAFILLPSDPEAGGTNTSILSTDIPTITPSPTSTPLLTMTPIPSAAPAFMLTSTFSPTPTHTPTPTPTFTPTPTPTFSPTPAPTFSPTPAPTFSPTPAPTFSPTPAPTFSPTPAPTFSPTPAPTFSPTPTHTPSPTPTSTPDNYCEPPVLTGIINENTEILTGIVEKGSTVYVAVHGENIQAAVSDSGVFMLPLPSITAGDVLAIFCEDANGNTAQSSVTVAVGIRGAIQAVAPVSTRLDQPIILTGTATAARELLVRMSVDGKERLAQLVNADEEGLWTLQVNPILFSHAERVDVVVSYSDGLSPEADAHTAFICDGQCSLAVDQAVLTEDMISISGMTDPGASMILSVNKQEIAFTAKENGYFVFDNLILTAGTQIQLSAVDPLGNAAQMQWQVEPGEREMIILNLPTHKEGYINAVDSELWLTGLAEEGFPILIDINSTQQTVIPKEGGAFSMRLNSIDLSEGPLTISAAYADGFRTECSTMLELRVDRHPPALSFSTVGDGQIEVTTTELSVQTEPNATLILISPQGEMSYQPDAQGQAVLPLDAQEVGAQYTIIAFDTAGNETTAVIEVIEAINDARVQIIRPASGETIRDGRLGISASILATSNINLYYIVTDGYQELAHGDISAQNMRKMSEDEYTDIVSQYDDLEGIYTGHTLRTSITLPEVQSSELMLSIYTDDIGEEPVLLAQQIFASSKSEEIAGLINETADVSTQKAAYERVTTDSFAFGFDKVSVQEFAPTQVYLTAYNWSLGNRVLYFDYIIDGRRYTTQQINEAGGSVNITYASRNVTEEFVELVPSIAPNMRRAGVIMLLDLSFLEEGEHEIQVMLISDSSEYRMESQKIAISSDVEVDKSIIQTLQNRWRK